MSPGAGGGRGSGSGSGLGGSGEGAVAHSCRSYDALLAWVTTDCGSDGEEDGDSDDSLESPDAGKWRDCPLPVTYLVPHDCRTTSTRSFPPCCLQPSLLVTAGDRGMGTGPSAAARAAGTSTPDAHSVPLSLHASGAATSSPVPRSFFDDGGIDGSDGGDGAYTHTLPGQHHPRLLAR